MINKKCSCTYLYRLSIIKDMQAIKKELSKFVEVNLEIQITLSLLTFDLSASEANDGENQPNYKVFFF